MVITVQAFFNTLKNMRWTIQDGFSDNDKFFNFSSTNIFLQHQIGFDKWEGKDFHAVAVAFRITSFDVIKGVNHIINATIR